MACCGQNREALRQTASPARIVDPHREARGTAPSTGAAPSQTLRLISGERIVIRESGKNNGGELMSFDLFLPPGAHVPAGHVHPVQEERFTIVAGRMRFRLGRRTILARPGETVRVPAGSDHWFGNDGEETSHARVEVRPALRMEELLEATAALGQAGHIPGTRLPLPSRLAVVLLDFHRELAIPHVSPLLTRVALAPLAWLGRRSRKH